jgi:hypothetical protein
MMLVAISPEALPGCWDELRQGVEKVLKFSMGLTTEQDIYERVLAGDWIMFAVYSEGAPVVVLVAEIRQRRDETRLLDVYFCWGGRVDEWIDLVSSAMDTIAAETGCAHIAFNGRAGWHKMAKRLGYEVNSMIFKKVVTP